MTIQVFAIERRTLLQPGQAPVTVERETVFRNGRGRKTVRVRKGNKTVSEISEPLNRTECRKVAKRKYVRRLYKKAERKTLKRLRGRDL
jgi:hypothetical protein